MVIHTPDTDVLLIALAVSTNIDANLFIRTGVKNNARIISITKVIESIKITYDLDNVDLVVKALLSLHAFTGCDTTSAFCGKGKVKPLKTMLKNSSYINAFAVVGNEPEILESNFQILKQFVCDMYGHVCDSTDMLRYRLYSSRQGKLEAKSIPRARIV